MLHHRVLSEDYKQAWLTIIAALISVLTKSEIKVVIIYLSSTFLRMLAATRRDEGPDFEVRVAS